jgi:cation transporter-like permease
MRMIRMLAFLPFAAMLIGPFFPNRVEPTVFGMPFLLAWFVAWIVLSAAIMAIIFRFDPENRDEPS